MAYIEQLHGYLKNNQELIAIHRLQSLYDKEIESLKKKYAKINEMGQYALYKLRKSGIQFIVLKGFAVMNILYENYWERTYNDIDILINEKDISKVEKALDEIGYIQGKFQEEKGIIVPSTRKEIIFQRMYTHQIHEFLKYDGELSEIDVNFRFEWLGYEKTKNILTNEIAFENTMPFNYLGKTYMSLNYDLMFIHLCCHVYNEAVYFVFNYFDKRKDLKEIKLFRLVDILKLIESNKNDWDNILNLANQYDIVSEISYTLSVIDFLFPNNIANKILSNFKIDYNIFNYYYDKEGVLQKWPISLSDRLFNLDIKRKAVASMFSSY